MKPPYYIKDFDAKGALEAYTWLSEFYTRYPTGLEVAEALHQVRRDLNLLPPPTEPKTKRTKKTIDTLSE